MYVCVCASGRAVLVCVDDHSVCQMINLCFAGGRESRCMWLFSARHDVLGCLTQSLIRHPVCRSAANTPACLPLSVFFVPTEDLPSCPSLTDRLSDFQLQSVLCSFGRISTLSLSHIGLFDVCFPSSGALPFPFCSGTVRAGGSAAVLALSAHQSSHPSIWSRPNYGDAICAKDCLNLPH